MSVELPHPDAGMGDGSLPEPRHETREAPEPAAHGSAVQAVFNDVDVDLEHDVDVAATSATTYDAIRSLWYDVVADRDREPAVVAELDGALEWLPGARKSREWVLVLTSSRWKAGKGEGDDYRSYYEYHLKLRERDEDGDLHKAPIALHVEIMPQFEDLVYKDGNALECPYGEGSRVVCWTTWADSSAEIESRMLDALECVIGADRDRLERARDYSSRRLSKAEAHHRVDIGWKRQLVEVLRQSESLIAYGGRSEIDAHQKRQKEGWLEALVDADRWELLGFDDVHWNIELKVYQAAGWHKMAREDPGHHPKLEASFGGVDQGALPHVDDWDDVMQTLRAIVSAHLEWAGVGREQLVADDYQPGPGAPAYEYRQPIGRREQLKERYEAISTDIYREALKSNTDAVYDILRTVAVERGATYDMLEDRTGLARSTIRYHVRRLSEIGVADRVGNPVIVVFPSLEVLENAEEILRTIYPDDAQEDMSERAEERRERRDELDDREPPETDDVDDHLESDDGDRDRGSWSAFADLDIEPHQIANALEREYLEPEHVRIRTDPYEWVR